MDPPQDSPARLPACKRCHARKRKCDRAYPRCSACSAVGVACEVDLRPADQSLVSSMNRLQSRVTWLEGIIRGALPGGEAISDIRTNETLPSSTSLSCNHYSGPLVLPGGNKFSSPGISLSTLIKDVTSPSSIDHAVLFPDVPYLHPAPDVHRIDWNDFDVSPPESPVHHVETLDPPLDFPPYLTTLDLLKRFSLDYKFVHQVVSLSQLERDVRVIYEDGEVMRVEHAASRFRVLCILYLSGEGILGYHKFDQVKWRGFRNRAMAELPCLCKKEDLTCVQVLTLLGVLAVYTPEINLSQIVAVAVRTAHAIGLHRSDGEFMGSYSTTRDGASVERVNDLRKRILWSLYLLDRLAQSVLGLPPCLRDEDIACSLPGPTTPDLGEASMATAQLRHAIAGRKLMGQIQEALYGSTVTPNALGEAIVAGFVNQIQFLDDISYQLMIIALHRPSRLIPCVPSTYIIILVDSAKTSLDLFAHYAADNKVILHWCYLYQLFTICVALAYGYHEKHLRFDLEEPSREEQDKRLHQCKETLSRFSCPQTSTFLAMFAGVVAALEEMQRTTSKAPFPDLRFDLQSLAASEYMDLFDPTGMTPSGDSNMNTTTQVSSLLGEW